MYRPENPKRWPPTTFADDVSSSGDEGSGTDTNSLGIGGYEAKHDDGFIDVHVGRPDDLTSEERAEVAEKLGPQICCAEGFEEKMKGARKYLTQVVALNLNY